MKTIPPAAGSASPPPRPEVRTAVERRRTVQMLMAAAASAALWGCGGGGGSDDAAAPPTAPTTPAPSPVAPPPASGGNPAPTVGRQVPAPVIGVTVDDISNLSAITTALSKLSRMPTTRIVFDEHQPASSYRAATEAIHQVSYVMGEILDSQYMDTETVQGYLKRAENYYATLGDVVDIWEIGNEINGEWLGKNEDVVAKMTGAYDLAKSQGRATALTLYYNEGCWEKRSNEMFTWTAANVPARMRQGLDYVWLSYYEEDCNGLKPDWDAVFTRLSAMFPDARLGFGEVGTTQSDKAEYLRRYYALKPPVANYVGGYFWWYFKQDMVPYTQPLWSVFNAVIGEQR